MIIFSTITMSPMLADADLPRVLAATVSVLVSVGVSVGAVFLIHFLFSLPMRRTECARLFLDLLEGALGRGQSVEAMVLSLASNRDRTLGIRFFLLAAHVENGLQFTEALKKVPRFLPPQISAMLLAGENLGDLKKVLPACREVLRERPAGVRSAKNYLIVVVLFFSPVFMLVLWMTTTFVIPKFKDVAAGMGMKLLPISSFVFEYASRFVIVEAMVFAGLTILTAIYIGGPQSARWFHRIIPADRMAWSIPWKRKRLQRTFSAMLAVLLDGGVPEAVAVRLAGDCTANGVCRRRAERIVAILEQGGKLEAAVRAFDDQGEFRWRLANTSHSHGGFLNALRGWHETLDARSFQQEEAAAHAITTGMVILNGLLVALIAIAMFGILIATLNGVLASS